MNSFAAPASVSAESWRACVEPENSSPVLICFVGPVDFQGKPGRLPFQAGHSFQDGDKVLAITSPKGILSVIRSIIATQNV